MSSLHQEFRFELQSKVVLCIGKHEGVVIGRTQYIDDANQYLVEYKDEHGHTQLRNFYSEQLLEGKG